MVTTNHLKHQNHQQTATLVAKVSPNPVLTVITDTMSATISLASEIISLIQKCNAIHNRDLAILYRLSNVGDGGVNSRSEWNRLSEQLSSFELRNVALEKGIRIFNSPPRITPSPSEPNPSVSGTGQQGANSDDDETESHRSDIIEWCRTHDSNTGVSLALSNVPSDADSDISADSQSGEVMSYTVAGTRYHRMDSR